jgi:hypothetical protein
MDQKRLGRPQADTVDSGQLRNHLGILEVAHRFDVDHAVGLRAG